MEASLQSLLFWKMVEDWIHFALVSKATSNPLEVPVTLSMGLSKHPAGLARGAGWERVGPGG